MAIVLEGNGGCGTSNLSTYAVDRDRTCERGMPLSRRVCHPSCTDFPKGQYRFLDPSVRIELDEALQHRGAEPRTGSARYPIGKALALAKRPVSPFLKAANGVCKMTVCPVSKPDRGSTRVLASIAAVVVASAVAAGPSFAQTSDANRILKAMSEFVGKQQNIAIAFDSDIEVVTHELQKIQFANSGTVLMSRPDKLRVTRSGGYSHAEVVFDGKAATLLNKDANVYTQLEAPGSVDQLVERLRVGHSVTAPGADLLLANVFSDLMEDVTDGKYIGLGVVDGVECEHLAFRTPETDWQIWIETGARPIPRKYVITSKSVTAAPQYTLRIKEWRSDPKINADSFTFTAPQTAKQVAVAEFPRADEVPDGMIVGGK